MISGTRSNHCLSLRYDFPESSLILISNSYCFTKIKFRSFRARKFSCYTTDAYTQRLNASPVPETSSIGDQGSVSGYIRFSKCFLPEGWTRVVRVWIPSSNVPPARKVRSVFASSRQFYPYHRALSSSLLLAEPSQLR